MKLFMVEIGATPPGRLIEQHDVFFGIAQTVQALAPQWDVAWPEAAGRWHIDCWREISHVNGYRISVVPREQARPKTEALFFINLGGYRAGDFEEYHHKLLLVAPDLPAAVAQAKASAFYRDFGFEGAVAHIDNRHGVDVDDVHNVGDVLQRQYKERYALNIERAAGAEDTLHIGYISREDFVGAKSAPGA